MYYNLLFWLKFITYRPIWSSAKLLFTLRMLFTDIILSNLYTLKYFRIVLLSNAINGGAIWPVPHTTHHHTTLPNHPNGLWRCDSTLFTFRLDSFHHQSICGRTHYKCGYWKWHASTNHHTMNYCYKLTDASHGCGNIHIIHITSSKRKLVSNSTSLGCNLD